MRQSGCLWRLLRADDAGIEQDDEAFQRWTLTFIFRVAEASRFELELPESKSGVMTISLRPSRKAGSPSRARTCDPRINSPLLYHLSYRGLELDAVFTAQIAKSLGISLKNIGGVRPLWAAPLFFWLTQNCRVASDGRGTLLSSCFGLRRPSRCSRYPRSLSGNWGRARGRSWLFGSPGPGRPG